MELKKIRSISKFAYYACLILRILMYVGIVAGLVFISYSPRVFETAEMNQIVDFSLSVELSNLTENQQKEIADWMEKNEDNTFLSLQQENNQVRVIFDAPVLRVFKDEINYEILFLAATTFLLSFIMLYLGKIFKELYQGESPFTNSIFGYMKMICRLFVVFILLPEYSIAPEINLFNNKMVNVNLISLKSAHWSFNFSLEEAIFVMIFFVLTYIIEYGCKLQQLSDETL
ncbi:MAG: hypothetical protein LLG09_08695 [Negativicutes bacterium]|nr:hypothetical protein [Negativicutes bacterium]